MAAALEYLQWHTTAASVLQWMPKGAILAASLLPAATEPLFVSQLVAFLAGAVSSSLQGCTGGTGADVVNQMHALDTALLQQSAKLQSDAAVALTALVHAVDAALTPNISEPTSSWVAGGEAFQSACQLRARLALTLQMLKCRKQLSKQPTDEADPPESSYAHLHAEPADSDIWRTVLQVNLPSSPALSGEGKGVTSLSGGGAVSAAAAASVAALFGDFDTSLGGCPSSILRHPNPVGPCKVTWSMLCILGHAATHSTDSRVPAQVGAQHSLPWLCWHAAALVTSREEQAALLQHVLTHPACTALRNALCEASPFAEWADKQLVTVINRLRRASHEDVEVFGGSAQNMDAAVHAVFPAALLCPSVLLAKLVEGAVKQQSQAQLLAGLLKELPALAAALPKQEGPATAPPTPIIVGLLAEHVRLSGSLQTDGEKDALQTCILELVGNHLSGSTKGSGQGGSSAACMDAETVLLRAVLPALHESTSDLALTLRLARQLAELCSLESLLSMERVEARRESVVEELLLVTTPVLDSSSRRIDLSREGLLTPMEVIEEAHALASFCYGAMRREESCNEPGLASSVCKFAESCSIWDRAGALCQVLQAQAGGGNCHPQLREIAAAWRQQDLREALVVSCAVLLPCCSALESERVINGVSQLVSSCCTVPLWCEGAEIETQGRASVVELLCRAVHAAALIPALVPIAGEDAAGLGGAPSEVRRMAVARLMHRVNSLTQAAVAQENGSPRHQTVLAVRCFWELCRCAGAVWAWYDCSVLKVGLMHMVQVARSCGELAHDVQEMMRKGVQLLESSPLESLMRAAIEAET